MILWLPFAISTMKNNEEITFAHFLDREIEHFADRGYRWLLQNKKNVQGLIEILESDLAANIDFSQLSSLNRSFITGSFREQESDLVFRVPWTDGGETEDLLIYILIEHQSTVDESMGFRMLYYMMLVWDSQRREWQQNKTPKSQRKLHPILPIVFYTGERRWQTPLSFDPIMDMPEALSRFVPKFDCLFLNLKETDAETLTKHGSIFGWLLKALQKEDDPKEVLIQALHETSLYLDSLDPEQASERLEAIHYLLMMILHRRPDDEQSELVSIVDRNIQEVEVESMAQSMAQVLLERGLKQGIERGERRAAIRYTLSILTERFPQHNVQSIEQALTAISNLESLSELVITASQVNSFEAFQDTLEAQQE